MDQKHSTSVGASKIDREGPRVFNVAEYFKNKSNGRMDFTEVNSEARANLKKKNSSSNIKDERRFTQANLMSMSNQNMNGKRRRNIQNILAQTDGVQGNSRGAVTQL